MFCRNCGKELAKGMIVCPYCAVPISSMAGNGQSNANIFEKTPEDRKFSVFAFIFVEIWLLFKGMWDACVITFLVGFVIGFIGGFCMTIPVVGTVINVITSILFIAIRIYWGINGKYYLRLRRMHGISFLKALKANKNGTI